MDAFAPPPYIASLAAAMNDGAKTTQAAVFGLLAAGASLLAVAVSTTDEDLLLEHAKGISQVGVQVAPLITFSIAPLVFVVVHIFVLTRYAILDTSLRHFNDQLRPLGRRSREQCYKLLSGVEYLIGGVMLHNSTLDKVFFIIFRYATIGVFPIFVLLSEHAQTLRYQNEMVNLLQDVGIVLDLLALLWFFGPSRFSRVAERSSTDERSLPNSPKWKLDRWILRFAFVLILAVGVGAIDLTWLQIAPPGENSLITPLYCSKIWSQPLDVLSQPLDNCLCPDVQFGCRYLTVERAVLVGDLWRSGVIAELNNDPNDLKDAMDGVRGIDLHGRRLLNVKLRYSAIYRADFADADLTNADLSGADLRGAIFSGAELRGAVFNGADLVGANLQSAHGLECAYFEDATSDKDTFPEDFSPGGEPCKDKHAH